MFLFKGTNWDHTCFSMHLHLSGPRNLFGYEAVRPPNRDSASVITMKQTCVIVILAF